MEFASYFRREYVSVGFKLIIYILFAYFSKRLIHRTVKFLFSKVHRITPEKKKKLKTIETLLANGFTYAAYFIILLIALKDLGVDTTPLITSAGVVGLAFSFGTQSLVKDLVYGIFVILEDQFNVGDEIDVGGMRGKVVKMNLRTTVLKDEEGNLIFIPNSELKKVKVIRKVE